MSDRMYIVHIQERIARIMEFAAGGRQDFLESPIIQDAVLRNFEVIGEAAKQLSPETKARYPDVNWRDVAGLRDVLIHNYMGVDLDMVWHIVQDRLPTLKRTVEDMWGDIENG